MKDSPPAAPSATRRKSASKFPTPKLEGRTSNVPSEATSTVTGVDVSRLDGAHMYPSARIDGDPCNQSASNHSSGFPIVIDDVITSAPSREEDAGDS